MIYALNENPKSFNLDAFFILWVGVCQRIKYCLRFIGCREHCFKSRNKDKSWLNYDITLQNFSLLSKSYSYEFNRFNVDIAKSQNLPNLWWQRKDLFVTCLVWIPSITEASLSIYILRITNPFKIYQFFELQKGSCTISSVFEY